MKYSERVHKKNVEKREKMADWRTLFGEMESAVWRATCEHNYCADFYKDFKVVTTLSRISIKMLTISAKLAWCHFYFVDTRK